MSDIVERLRNVTSRPHSTKCQEAADEIERLRELLRDLLESETLTNVWHLRVREALGDAP